MADLTSHRDQIANLLATYRTKDPRLVDILQTMMNDIHQTIITVNPIERNILAAVAIGDPTPPDDITVVLVTLLPFNIQVVWSGVINGQLYEMREGTDWATSAFIVKTPSLSVVLNPRLIGTYHMLLKAISPSNVYSVNALPFNIVIPEFGSISLSTSVIDNNVLLSWTTPSSPFAIDHYNVYRNGLQFAQVNANFLARFEAAAGTYLFEVEAVDIVGNISAKAGASATVSTPPDYILQDFRNVVLADATLVNTMYDVVNDKIIGAIDRAETIQQHFVNMSWADPEDQVTAGYARWIQDNLLAGHFLDEYDYGTVLTNSVAVVNYVKENYSGTDDVFITIGMSWSDDGISWSTEIFGGAQFIPSLRYLRTRVIYTALNDDSMVAVTNVTISLSVKREVDSGSVTVNASDVDGTEVFFNKTFKDIDSLTATCDDVEPITVVASFVDVPNPISFKLFAFDSAGIRVTKIVDWKSRGIV